MLLLQPDEATSWVNTRLRERKHWVLIPLDSTGFHAVDRIEQLFYSGEANADFELVMVPAPEVVILGLFFASKGRLSTEALANEIGQHPALLEEHDIICLGDDVGAASMVFEFMLRHFSCEDRSGRKEGP